MKELIEELYDGKFIVKSDLEKFGEMCQLIIISKALESDDPINYLKKELFELKDKLLVDDNKLQIITNNRSLN